MTNEQIIGIISAAFVVGIFLGGFAMAALHNRAVKKSLKQNVNLN
jgi:hypothetical protein